MKKAKKFGVFFLSSVFSFSLICYDLSFGENQTYEFSSKASEYLTYNSDALHKKIISGNSIIIDQLEIPYNSFQSFRLIAKEIVYNDDQTDSFNLALIRYRKILASAKYLRFIDKMDHRLLLGYGIFFDIQDLSHKEEYIIFDANGFIVKISEYSKKLINFDETKFNLN